MSPGGAAATNAAGHGAAVAVAAVEGGPAVWVRFGMREPATLSLPFASLLSRTPSSQLVAHTLCSHLQVRFGPVLRPTFSVCSLSRYTGAEGSGKARGRILDGTPQNWLLGHNGGDAGVAHWREWVTRPSGDAVSRA